MAVLIVVSGVLVLVALIFLIIGLLGEGLAMIWLSIGTSVVAGVFLLLGALQRRGTPAPVAETGPSTDMLERVTAVSMRPRETEAATEAPATAEQAAPAAAAAGGQVSVVPGRPRYHVETCRFLAGRPDVETMDVDDARSEGYTACGVCKPDVALAAAASAPEPEPEPEMAEEPVAEEEAPAPAKKAPAKRTRTAAAAGGSAATATVEAPAKPAKKAAAKGAAKAAPAKATSSQVVVIPDRGKYHNETCRFVKDVPGTVTLAKTSAKRQGYVACGVCKPG